MQRLGAQEGLSIARRAGLMAGVTVVAGALGMAAARFMPATAPTVSAVARPTITGEFELLDTTGRKVRWADVGGRPQLVFFGFTHCPEACPTTLANASQALADPELAGKNLRVLFISVDPQRDTVETVRDYVGNFGKGVTGLTGDPAGIRSAASAFGVFFEAMPADPDGDYMVDHTATLFLLGGTNEILETIPYGASAEEIAGVVKRHL